MSAEVVGSIEDLLIIILSKLPARSLLQFRSVSRHWNVLILSSRLAFLHFNPNAISGFFLNITCFGRQTRGAGEQFIPLRGDSLALKPPLKNLLHISQGIKILHACNGLLLCGDTYFNSMNVIQILYLYNPTLGWYTQIPISEGMRRPLTYGLLHEHHWILVFDPLKSSSYKIIYLFSSEYESNRCHYSIEIYSSETGLWKLVNNHVVLGEGMNLSINFSKGVLLNGVIYWPSFNSQSSLCFDVAEERVKSISMPSNGLGNFCYSGFVESGGHLYCIEQLDSQCYVHEMEDCSSDWFLKYSVDMDIVLAACQSMVREGAFCGNYSYSVLSFIHGVDQDDVLVFYIAGIAVYYGINRTTVKKLCDLNAGYVDDFAMVRFHGPLVHKHIETLLTVPGYHF